ncbi:hypothetical protein AJ79_07700 [Helicocarpus griseus UAMH5409]|uniref:Uncharacterized protein n=1 Tax=Helicocarpus griseus UAMH5409 TaxID=1447875 RepID=A0A2B7WRZ0_9EURO|nr:hypothetical protein AJ79_07700 [Helicocarpus griseus UAMH5409]
MATASKHRTPLPKQPLSKPNKNSTPSNPSAQPADLELRSTVLHMTEDIDLEEQKQKEVPVIEFDSSRAPQPFLDGEEALERLNAARKGVAG